MDSAVVTRYSYQQQQQQQHTQVCNCDLLLVCADAEMCPFVLTRGLVANISASGKTSQILLQTDIIIVFILLYNRHSLMTCSINRVDRLYSTACEQPAYSTTEMSHACFFSQLHSPPGNGLRFYKVLFSRVQCISAVPYSIATKCAHKFHVR